jgi:hypothetical protein
LAQLAKVLQPELGDRKGHGTGAKCLEDDWHLELLRATDAMGEYSAVKSSELMGQPFKGLVPDADE